MRGSSAPGRGLISGGTAPLRGIGRVTGRLRRCLVPAPGCLAPDDPLHASCVTRQYRLPGEKALALEITRRENRFLVELFLGRLKRLRSARVSSGVINARRYVFQDCRGVSYLIYLLPRGYFFPALLYWYRSCTFVIRAAQRSGQPLPEPRAELAFASDVPGAPLLLHRQI